MPSKISRDLIRCKVKTTPGSRKELWKQNGEHTYEAFVQEPAQNGLANRRVKLLVARAYGVPVNQVSLSTGHSSRSKTFVVTMR
jgi:uncharacterized protein YggU (UPF0235/DUF167 family)